MTARTMRRQTPSGGYSVAEVLHAIAREVGRRRPGGIGLAAPREIRNLWDGSTPPTVILPLDNVAGVLRWAHALRADSACMTGALSGAGFCVSIAGRIPRGPKILVESWIYGVTLPTPVGVDETRVVSLDELAALAGAR